jgi:serine/threonine protein kinase
MRSLDLTIEWRPQVPSFSNEILRTADLSQSEAEVTPSQSQFGDFFIGEILSGMVEEEIAPYPGEIQTYVLQDRLGCGLCGFIAPHEMMQTFCGSPSYCAPECLSRLSYDGRLADIWWLGIILFAIVTGSHTWTITNTSLMLRQILKGNYTVPAHVSQKCRGLLQGMRSNSD